LKQSLAGGQIFAKQFTNEMSELLCTPSCVKTGLFSCSAGQAEAAAAEEGGCLPVYLLAFAGLFSMFLPAVAVNF
jgi:hypothetical protein